MESQKPLQQCCLKISYGGQINYIICPAGSTYEDILKIAIDRFAIPKEYQAALSMTNESGYTFDKHVFEYFILLFPTPEIIFFVRVDYAKVQRLASAAAAAKKKRQSELAKTKPFGYSRLNNKRSSLEMAGEDELYGDEGGVAAPVRRQNCFIGDVPAIVTAAGATVAERQPNGRSQAVGSQQQSKRMKVSKQGQMKTKVKKTKAKSPVKRLLRV